jgi:ADP-heptose:LPS heptosyltransferase
MKGPALPPLLFFVRIPTLLAIFWRRYVSRRTIAGVSCKEPRSFLIYRLDSLSDGVLTTPFFRALKSADPKSRCTVVVQASYKSLLAANPYIDEVLALPHVKPAWLPQRLRRLLAAVLFYWTNLRNRHFDFAVSPRWDVDEHLATFLCALTDAASRVGYSEKASEAKQRMNRGFDSAFDVCLAPGPVQHETLRNLAVAEALSASICDAGVELYVTQRDRRHAARLLGATPGSAKLVAIGIGANSSGRRWPLERYADVLRRLGRGSRICPVIVCSGSEFGDAVALGNLLLEWPIIVCGAQLRRVAAVLERCELFIGNDNGCADMAAAMGCKVVVISRHPRNGDRNHFNSPLRFAPQGKRVRVLQSASGLDDCMEACCSPEPHCIKQVSVEEVVEAAREMLSDRAATTKPATDAAARGKALHPLLESHSLEAVLRALDALQPDVPGPFA